MMEEIDAISPVGAAAQPDFSVPRDSAAAAAPVVQPPPPVARPAPPRPDASRSTLPQSPPALPTAESIEAAVKQINARLANGNRFLELRVDAQTGITVAEVRNAATGEVIQQIPSVDVMHLAQMLYAWTDGKTALVDLLA